jgi:chorismate synthase
MRFLTAGESHGPALVTIVEGLPAGLSFSSEALAGELARRRLGFGRGARMRIEQDELEVLGGIRHGRTLGSPVSVLIRNTEWARWSQEMAAEGEPAGIALTKPRPGHADLAGMQKYDTTDARNILERASARETAARTVAGYLAKCLLDSIGISIVSHVVSIGSARVDDEADPPGPGDLDRVDASSVRCFHPEAERAMVEAIEEANRAGDTLGGVVEVLAYSVPPGLGSHVHWDRRLDSLLAAALMSIPAIKAVEVGDGLASASRLGSAAHDEILTDLTRATNRAGGIEGGMSIGGTVRLRAAMKPLSTLRKGLGTVDVATGEPAQAFFERSDVCAVPAAGVVAEQMTALVLASEAQRMFGGDTVDDFMAAHAAYLRRLER